MNKYEAMFVIKPDLTDEAKKNLFNQINEVIQKHNGNVVSANIWAEKRKLTFKIKKYLEGSYYLVNFNVEAKEVAEIRNLYNLNENILRALITNIEK
jgi:small subunit ribosomal protein S6